MAGADAYKWLLGSQPASFPETLLGSTGPLNCPSTPKPLSSSVACLGLRTCLVSCFQNRHQGMRDDGHFTVAVQATWSTAVVPSGLFLIPLLFMFTALQFASPSLFSLLTKSKRMHMLDLNSIFREAQPIFTSVDTATQTVADRQRPKLLIDALGLHWPLPEQAHLSLRSN